jgi:Uri superfamily endonuclease
MDKKDLFLQDLSDLLMRYNASIEFGCSDCSDTHGLYDERIEVWVDGKEVARSIGWSLEAGDLDARD